MKILLSKTRSESGMTLGGAIALGGIVIAVGIVLVWIALEIISAIVQIAPCADAPPGETNAVAVVTSPGPISQVECWCPPAEEAAAAYWPGARSE